MFQVTSQISVLSFYQEKIGLAFNHILYRADERFIWIHLRTDEHQVA